jgi:MSHA biogenesis protein MshE
VSEAQAGTQTGGQAGRRKKIRIGELLVGHGVITAEQLDAALAEQKKSRQKLGRALIAMGFLNEDRLLNFLSEQLGIPFIDLSQRDVDPEVAQRLPETHARRLRAILLEETADGFLVGQSDPTNLFALDELARILKRPLHQAVVRESDLLRTIDLCYRNTEELAALATELGEEIGDTQFSLAHLDVHEDAADAPVVKLLTSVFEDAVLMGASDIHIEPDESVLRIRKRVDGVLDEQLVKETRIAPALVLRLKLISGLDISEKRLPQDGRFNMKVQGRNIDVRLSTMPVQFGESVVMRLLDQSNGTLDPKQLGMPAKILARFQSLIHQPHGLFLVTGPTGSGKTTTLYAALGQINSSEKKIITVEDPVEYRLPRINQVQVNPKIDLTFASVLRAALRQDPDIVMIGEMRDRETVDIGLRSAMTGHLVLSTLHTNDAISSTIRLIDMGAEGFLVATSLRAILAQRLVRKLCGSCSEESSPNETLRAWLHATVGKQAERLRFKRGQGCARCNNTGYSGRIGVYELLEINHEMADALRRGNTSAYTQAVHASKEYRPLAICALEYAAKGITSLDEVLRVAGEIDVTPLHAAKPERREAEA